MESTLIKKSIEINAPKEEVWKTLIEKERNKKWFAAFSEGTEAHTDWQVGSKAIFADGSGSGILGVVTENKPNELLAIEYTGMVRGGNEDFESEEAKAVKGSKEIYWLKEANGITQLDIESDMGAEYFDMMSASWDQALVIIKDLSEA